MRNIKLIYKLVTAFAVIFAVIAFLGHSTFKELSSLAGKTERLQNESLNGVRISAEMDDALMAGYISMCSARLATTPNEKQNAIDEFNVTLGEMASHLEKFKQLSQGSQRQKIYEETEETWLKYAQSAKQYMKLFASNAPAAQLTPLWNSTFEKYEQVDELMHINGDRDKESGAALMAEVQATKVSIRNHLAFALVLTLAICIGMTLTLSRAILLPIREVTNKLTTLASTCSKEIEVALQKMARGDLTHKIIPVTTPIANPSKDEVGQLGLRYNELLKQTQNSVVSYQQCVENLSSIINQIKTGADIVADSSHNVASISEESKAATNEVYEGSQSLAQNAETASTTVTRLNQELEKTAAVNSDQFIAVQQASKALGEASESIEQVDAAVTAMRESASQGSLAVHETITSIEALKEQVETAATKVQELDAAGEQIGNIVNTIENIADQTNLLALNAAIEAARAGEHGRGFAVVADEVRKLAEQSSRATREISQLILSVRSVVAETVDSITTTASSASKSVENSSKAGTVLAEIIEASERVEKISSQTRIHNVGVTEDMTQVAQISETVKAALENMKDCVEDVMRAITDVATISEESSACANELNVGVLSVAESADNLSKLSSELQSVVSSFKLPKQEVDLPENSSVIKVAA